MSRHSMARLNLPDLHRRNMQAQNLQLAISANATVKSLLLDRENDAMQRLQEVSQHLSELIDNLETEFLKYVATNAL